MAPPDDLPAALASHRRLLDRLASLTNPDVRRPSKLPDWTVGHLVTHLARNADALTAMIDAAGRAEVADQYPGGLEQRNADIEAGSQRPAKALVADLTEAQARLEAAWAATPDDLWRSGRGRGALAGVQTLEEWLFRRLREVEVHHVDLGLGYTTSDWPPTYVDAELGRGLARLADRLGADDRGPFAAWLLGRGAPDTWPELAPWG